MGFKTANYYARGAVFGLLLWFAIIFILFLGGFSPTISSAIGDMGQIILLLLLLIICCIVGFYINKFTWKYTLASKL